MNFTLTAIYRFISPRISHLTLILTLTLASACGDGDNAGPQSSGGSEGNVTVRITSSGVVSSSAARAPTLVRMNGFESLIAGVISKVSRATQSPSRSDSSMNFTNTNVTQGTVITVESSGCTTLGTVDWCPCTIQNQTGNNYLWTARSGHCATPSDLGGGISAIAVGAIGDMSASNPSARILGGGMELSPNQTGTLDVSELSLSATNELTGEDTLFEANPTNGFGDFSILLSHIDVKIPKLINTNEDPFYYTLRYVFFTQPINEESVVSSCGVDSHALANWETGTKILGERNIYRNDVLLCKKTTESDVCEDDDFQWIDKTTAGNEAFASTRPATENTYRNEIVADDELSCTLGEGGIPDMAVGGLALLGALESRLTVSSALTGNTRTYTAGGTTGSKLTVNMDIDSSNSVFIETSGAPLQAFLDAKLAIGSGAGIAPYIHFIPAYIRYKAPEIFECPNGACSYTERDSGFSAGITVEVSD